MLLRGPRLGLAERAVALPEVGQLRDCCQPLRDYECLQGLERLLHPPMSLRLLSNPGLLVQDLLPQSSHLQILLVEVHSWDLGILRL